MICFLLLVLDFVCSFPSYFRWKVRLVFFVCLFVFRFFLLPNIRLHCYKFPFSVQFSSVTQSCPTFCDPMDRSTSGLSIHHQLPEFTQTHVHWVSDAIQPSHPLRPLLLLLSIFPSIRVFSNEPALRGQSIGVSVSTSVLPMNIQDWCPLGWTVLISLQFKGLSKESSPTPQFKSINSSVLSFLYSPTLTSIQDYWKKHSLD